MRKWWVMAIQRGLMNWSVGVCVTQPQESLKVELRRYGEEHPSDEVVRRLVEECEGAASACSTTTEGGDDGESKTEDSEGGLAVSSGGDGGAAVSWSPLMGTLMRGSVRESGWWQVG